MSVAVGFALQKHVKWRLNCLLKVTLVQNSDTGLKKGLSKSKHIETISAYEDLIYQSRDVIE
jgi:hypothetical protein